MSTVTENRAGARAPLVELSQTEQRRYSLRRALAVAAGLEARSFESEVSEEIALKLPTSYQRRGGLFIPTILSRAALDAHTTGRGAELIGEQAGAFITALRKRALVLQLGAPHHGAAWLGRLPPPGHGRRRRVGGGQPRRRLRGEQPHLKPGADATEALSKFDALQPPAPRAINAFG
jgi:hypothetical protein